MPESKTYVFGNDANNSALSMLAPLFQQRGLDPNVVLSMMNNRGNGCYGEGGWFMWIIFLFFLMGWGNNGNGFGWGNHGTSGATCAAGDAALANLITNNDGRDLLMQAINGNGNAIGRLADMANCSVGQIQQSINAVMSQIQNVGNQVGQSSLQVINAIQAGNCDIAKQIADCCCENRLAICQQTNTLQQSINNVGVGQERGFANVAYETQRQTCEVRDAIRENTAQVLAGQRCAEMRELNRELAERDRKIAEQAVIINNGQQTAIFGQMITQATAPIAGAVNALQKDVDGIKCKLPETATIPYSPVIGVPTCVAANYGLGFGYGFGVPNAWG